MHHHLRFLINLQTPTCESRQHTILTISLSTLDTDRSHSLQIFLTNNENGKKKKKKKTTHAKRRGKRKKKKLALAGIWLWTSPYPKPSTRNDLPSMQLLELQRAWIISRIPCTRSAVPFNIHNSPCNHIHVRYDLMTSPHRLPSVTPAYFLHYSTGLYHDTT